MSNEKIGRHKGALETLMHEKKELSRLLQIVNSQIQRNMQGLEQEGIDSEQFIQELQQDQENQQQQKQKQKKQSSRRNSQNHKNSNTQASNSRNSNRSQNRQNSNNKSSSCSERNFKKLKKRGLKLFPHLLPYLRITFAPIKLDCRLVWRVNRKLN